VTMLPVFLPNTSYALNAYYVIASANVNSNFACYDGVQYGRTSRCHAALLARSPGELYTHSRMAGFGAEVKSRIFLSTYALTAEHVTHALFFLGT